MLRVGLTGGLGSGKSTVSDIFRSLGAHVLDADTVGRQLMQPGQSVYKAIVERFGEEVLMPGEPEARPLNRKLLATMAFEGGRLEELNDIVHPAVIAAQEHWASAIGEQHPDAIVMIESALIFETKYGGDSSTDDKPRGDSEDRAIAAAITTTAWKRFDRIVLVTARQELKIARYLHRVSEGHPLSLTERHVLEDDARQRLAAQIPDEVKSPLCDYVIENNSDVATLEAASRRVFAALRDSATALRPS